MASGPIIVRAARITVVDLLIKMCSEKEIKEGVIKRRASGKSRIGFR